jgi:RNA polymerase sigma-70 factor (ECF subfamily)
MSPTPTPRPGAPDELDELVAAVRAGDVDRYRAVVERCEPSVRLVVAAVLPDGASVDDVVNEAFLTAYLKLEAYAAGTDFLAWVRSIAWRTAQNERRRWTRRARAQREYHAAILDLVEPEVGALGQMLGKDAAALRRCLEQLAPAARRVVEQHYFDGVACGELGRVHGKGEGWARLVIFRARAALLRCLEGQGLLEVG